MWCMNTYCLPLQSTSFPPQTSLYPLCRRPIPLKVHFNLLNAELNRIYHSLALLGAHPILHISRIRVNIIALSTLNLPTRFFAISRLQVYGFRPHHTCYMTSQPYFSSTDRPNNSSVSLCSPTECHRDLGLIRIGLYLTHMRSGPLNKKCASSWAILR